VSVKKLDDGRYLVDIRPKGALGKRIRRKFNFKSQALAFERYALSTMHSKEWVDKPPERRTVLELIQVWWRYHGCTHKYGEDYKKRLEKIDRDMGHPRAYMLTRAFLVEYRAVRLQGGVTPKTVNRDLVILSGVFRVLIEVDEYHHENPLSGLKKLKAPNKGMGFLSGDEIEMLLSELDEEEKKITIFCLHTGARWGEAEGLRVEHVIGNRAMFLETKTGTERVVPISQELADLILTRKTGRVFQSSYATIREVIKRVKPDLPKGQAVHVLRHTFATHFMMNGGSIITLQRILGHRDIKQTMAYAHFAPDYLTDAIRFNPMQGSVHKVSID
jgi:integrase